MPTNINTLFIAWASSLILVVGGILMLELTYSPEEHAPQEVQMAEQAHGTDEAPSDNSFGETEYQDPISSQEHASPNDINSHDMPLTGMPAPGQQVPQNADAMDFSGFSHTIPAVALPELLEDHNAGALPRIAEDGRKPIDIYAAARPKDKTSPRIALLVTDLGKRSNTTKRALEELPPEISLAFSPYSRNLNQWGEQARREGHEVLLTIPMEPVNYPQNDPGGLSLLTSLSSRENVNMLRSSLARLTGYVGVINYMGSRFTASSESMRPILDELKVRGLMFVDSRTTPYSRAATMARAVGVPTAINNGYIDEELGQEQIIAELTKLEKRAQSQGAAMGVARPYPVTFEAIKVWSHELKDRGFILVPVTSIANRQALPR